MPYTNDYLLDKKIKIYQPVGGYKTSSDAVWIAAAVNNVKEGDNILDVGAGCGAISLCLAKRMEQKNITILGIEKQKDLYDAAMLNAKENNFNFVNFINSDIFNANIKPCSFAHVVTNPPYSFDDMPSPNISKAQAHNFDNTNLEKWIDFCIKMIKPKGYLYVINRAEALEKIIVAISSKLGKIEVLPLYSKKGQNAKRIIIRAKKDSKAPLIIYPGIIVHNDDGTYSDKSQSVLRHGNAI